MKKFFYTFGFPDPLAGARVIVKDAGGSVVEDWYLPNYPDGTGQIRYAAYLPYADYTAQVDTADLSLEGSPHLAGIIYALGRFELAAAVELKGRAL